MTKLCAIIAAAGNSTRFAGAEKKTFIELRGLPVWLHSANVFASHPGIDRLIVAVSPDDLEFFLQRFAAEIRRLKIKVVTGGDQRCDTVAKALTAAPDDCDLVAIHDAARPCFDINLLQTVIDGAISCGAAIPAVPVNSTIKRAGIDNMIETTVDRENLFLAQTPQVFQRQVIINAYQNRGQLQLTDEAALLESQGTPVAIVPGSKFNIKITHPQDLKFAESCLLNSL